MRILRNLLPLAILSACTSAEVPPDGGGEEDGGTVCGLAVCSTPDSATSDSGAPDLATPPPACTPVPHTDFIETISWNVRRVEPVECAVLPVSTPVFSWPKPTDLKPATSMTLLVRRPLDGYMLSRDTTTPRLLLADEQLASGAYEWQVRYTNKLDAVVVSEPRRFAIGGGTLLALPSGVALNTNVTAKARPRALPSGVAFATIAAKAQAGEYQPSYAAFLAKANDLRSKAAAAVPPNKTRTDFASDLEYNQWLLSLMHLAADEGTAIETLGYAGRFTGDTTFDQAAIDRLLNLAAWPTNGATSEAQQDQANREIYKALGLGLDLFQTQLSAMQRQTIVTSLKDRLQQAMAKFGGLDGFPYDSHLLTAAGYTTEALMYAAGTPEFPEAQDLLATSWEVLITTLGSWGSTVDGGYANGDSYGWFSMTYLSRVAAAIRLVAELDLTPLPAIGDFMNNQIALTPAGQSLMGQFGDGIDTNRNYFDYAWAEGRLIASVTGKPEHEWYWRALPSNVSRALALPPMHYLLLGLRTPTAPASTPVLPDSWVFKQAGVVAMHSQTTDPARTSLFFRSSRFGSFNHSHADNNAFTFVSKGKEIFISGGYYPYYNSPHHALVGRATRFKNALTFDGGIGQAEPTDAPTAPGAPIWSMDTRGELLGSADDGAWAYAIGDATLAYRGRNPMTLAFTPLLSDAVRAAAFHRTQRVAVIYDWATSATARTFELNFQSVQQPTLVGTTVHVVNGGIQACLDVYGPAGSFAFTSGFPIPPETTEPDQFHTRYSASTPSQQWASVTVIREDCRDVPVSVHFTDTSATVDVQGAKTIVFDRRTVTLP